MKISTQPLKGFRDFIPEDWRLQKYIFKNWERVCEMYGYKEYNGPVLESVDIYNKSGEDVGTTGKELYTFTDRGGRMIALRPEMTPTVGRMIAAYGKMYSKPIRWYSIAQFFRAENPQRGRGREFFQLNADIFGDDSVQSEIEIISLVVDMMKSFGAKKEMFTVKINDRTLLNEVLDQISTDDNQKTQILRFIDAYKKKPEGWLDERLKEMGLSDSQIAKLNEFLNATFNDLSSYKSATRLVELFNNLKKIGIDEYCTFDPSLARGFDYYTGMVFEVFDNNVLNNRAMFGGGRYDRLLEQFGNEKVPAVGFAPGDMTMRLFLETWGLLPNNDALMLDTYYLPIMMQSNIEYYYRVLKSLQAQNVSVLLGYKDSNVSKAIIDANKQGCNYCIIVLQDEIDKNVYKIKNLTTGEEVEKSLI